MSLRYDTVVTQESSQNRIISMICEDGPVFDVGCATGNLGQALRISNKNNELFGLEFDPVARSSALQKKIYKDIYQLDLDQPFELAQNLIGFFKYIVLADVLEHLKDAKAVLKQLVPYLRKDGCFLISLPNVMNFEVQAAMASATAKYTETGLLDYTHLHFYDLNEIAQLCTHASCSIRNLSFTFRNLENINRLSDPENMPLEVANYIFEKNPHAWEFQYIFELHPSKLPMAHLLAVNEQTVQHICEKAEKRVSGSYVISCLFHLYYRKENEPFSEEKSMHYPVFMYNGTFSLNIPLSQLSDEDTFLQIAFGRPGEIWKWGKISWYDANETFISEVDFERLNKDHKLLGVTVSNHQLKINQNWYVHLHRNRNMKSMHITMSFADRTDFPGVGKKILCHFSRENSLFNEKEKTESFFSFTEPEMLCGEFSIPAEYENSSVFRIDLFGLRGIYELCSCGLLHAGNIETQADLNKNGPETRSGLFSFSKDGVEYFYLAASENISFTISADRVPVKRIRIQLKPVSIPDKLRWFESAVSELSLENHAQAALLNEIYNSKSWRFTAPWRKMVKGIRYWRHNGTRAFLKRICQKIEANSPFFARQMARQRKFRDIRRLQGNRKALAYVYGKIYAKLFPTRYIQERYKTTCSRFSHACLIIDHNLGGGANVYRNNFIREKLSRGEKCILLHNNMCFYDRRDYSLKFYEETLEQFEDVHLNNLREVFAVLNKISPALVVYNSLVFYPDMAAVLRWMRKCKGDLLLLIHDFFPICQVFNMVDDRNQYCKMERNCDECLANHSDIRHLYGKPFSKAAWKKLWVPVFARSKEIRFFSASTQEIIKAWGVGNEKKYTLVPHSMDYYTPPNVRIIRGNKPKFAVIGSIYNIPKGTLVVEELAKKMAPETLLIIGSYQGNPVDNIIETGPFTRDTLPRMIMEHSVNMLLIPSIWPETFSYLTSEIIMMKVPLLVFDLGAQGEKVAEYQFGAIIPEMNADSVLETADKLYRRLKNNYPYK